MILAILKWSFLCVGLFVWGCPLNGQIRDFTYSPSTDETFPEIQEARLYESGLGPPHQVIGEVMIRGRAGEDQESLERRLLEGARQIGAQGVIVLETGQMVSDVGTTGVRHDLNVEQNSGGASKRYRVFPEPLPIEEERMFIRGLAIRFIED